MADQYDGSARSRSPGPNDGHVHFDTASKAPSTTGSTGTASRSTSAMTSPLSAEFHLEREPSDPPKFPALSHHSAPSTDSLKRPTSHGDSVDEEEAVAQPFQRTSSPHSDSLKRNRGAEYEKVGDTGVCKMHKFSLYETAMRYYIVGADVMDRRFRILKIDRTADSGNLSITEDEIVYTKKEMSQLLNAVDDGNKSTGGLKLRCSMWGLLGFIRFTGAYYMLLITKRSQVAMIGGHFVYQVDGTELVPLTTGSGSRFKTDSKNTEEARFLTILNNLDLTRSFYFSYSYDITRTLQHNICTERAAIAKGDAYPHAVDYNSMFVWNSFLLEPATDALKNTFDWCLPVIHGYIDQAALPVYGRTVYITVIARRSRHFAGARFLKRGANDRGYVANDVETEQIVQEVLTTSFHAPGPKLFSNPNFTSYVQHRGSIPLYWTQDNSGVAPKPPIELNLVDPFYSVAALHFDNLFERYGAPVYVLNLVKARERTPRESKLLHEFTTCIKYLNQFLPEGKKIIHKAWDMSRASKTPEQDVIGTLESIAEEVVTTTGFFHNGDGQTAATSVQNGIARTNCIDCLDRTNAAQFVIGKKALGYQLHALGIIAHPSIAFDTDAVNLFTHMYHDHGDTIAIQYGGSQLVNTMETYRKINAWHSHSRDMVESFKRYYNNSFLDGQRQEAYNLFLGNYRWTQGGPMLWDLATDYHLHHTSPQAWSSRNRRSYINWFTPVFLETRTLPAYVPPLGEYSEKALSYFDDYWLEYYKPLAVSSIVKVFSFMGRMNSTAKYFPTRPLEEGRFDLSPFKVRIDPSQYVAEQKKASAKKGVTIREPQDEGDDDDDAASIRSGMTATSKKLGIQRWLQPIHENGVSSPQHSIMKGPPHITFSPPEEERQKEAKKLDKSKAAQWTFTQVVHESLNPSVSEQEAEDYARYISHPQTLPLVVSNAVPKDIDEGFLEYVGGAWKGGGAMVGARDGLVVSEEDLVDYMGFLEVNEKPLEVTEGDGGKKRYKAYRKWLKGKSLFKQQPID